MRFAPFSLLLVLFASVAVITLTAYTFSDCCLADSHSQSSSITMVDKLTPELREEIESHPDHPKDVIISLDPDRMPTDDPNCTDEALSSNNNYVASRRQKAACLQTEVKNYLDANTDMYDEVKYFWIKTDVSVKGAMPKLLSSLSELDSVTEVREDKPVATINGSQ